MNRKKLPGTDLLLSELGMGGIQITRLEWQESLRVVREVADLGVNWFDTAHGYFDSEQRIGEALQGRRDRIVLFSKSGAAKAEQFTDELDESLRRLRTDYIDVFFFHGGGVFRDESGQEVIQAAQKAVEAGKVRYLGFSAHAMDVALRGVDSGICSVAMVPANFISREYIDGEFMRKARKNQVGVIAMKPFGGGRMDNATVCLKFLRSYPDLFPCVGIEHPEEMAENIAVWDSREPLSTADQQEMQRIIDLLGNRFCRGCGYCMPCPQGISIPTVTFMKVFAKQMPREKVVTEKHDEIIRIAEQCTNCRQCVEKCPYGLEIPDLIRENIAFYHEFAAGNR